MNKKTILELQDITKEYYQGRSVIEVLKNFSFKVKEEESIAILGESGSGKSTLLAIIGMLDNNHRGKMIISDINTIDLTEAQQNEIRNNVIGFIFQKYMLIPTITTRENVALPRVIRGTNYKQALEDADKLLIRLGLEGRIFNMPGELSGGEQQRVAIARSLINQPSIILADEPTGNLDPENARLVFDLLKQNVKDNSASLVMVTHNYEFANELDITLKL